MNKEIAQKAAKWWADQLRQPAKLDHGDDSETGAMTKMLATLLQHDERKGQTPEQIDAFESALADLIESDERLYGGPMIVGNDYHPCHALQQAAASAGLDLGMATLPWKTVMWIHKDSIDVACGYGAPAEALP